MPYTDPFGGLPHELSAESQMIKNRQAIAQALMQQGMQGPQEPQVKGRFQGRVSPFSAITSVAQNYVGNKKMEDANKQFGELAGKYEQGANQAMGQYEQTRMGAPGIAAPIDNLGGGPARPEIAPNPRKAVMDAMMSQYPQLRQVAGMDLKSMEADKILKQQQDFKKQENITKAEDKINEIGLRAAEGRISKSEADERMAALRLELKQMGIDAQRDLKAVVGANHPPIVQTDNSGNVKFFDRSGNLIKDVGAVGKPTGAFEKTQNAKKQLSKDLDTAISELEKATADNGLIDKSTGSGAGAMVDSVAGFFGKATPGAVAVGQMKPVFDLVLKMVPRFEGPQSDKDTISYKEAAGQLANPATPNEQKKAAGLEILRLMKLRKGQFINKDVAGTEADTGLTPPTTQGDVRVVDW